MPARGLLEVRMIDMNSYPRMLFRGDETSRADSRDEMLAKRALGWQARLLPGETPEDIGDTSDLVDAESGVRGVPALDDPSEDFVLPKKRGRPKKDAE